MLNKEDLRIDPEKVAPKTPFYKLKFKPNPTKAIKFSKYKPHRGKKEKERWVRRVKQGYLDRETG